MTENEEVPPIGEQGAGNPTEGDRDREPGGDGGKTGAKRTTPDSPGGSFADEQPAIDLEAVRDRAS